MQAFLFYLIYDTFIARRFKAAVQNRMLPGRAFRFDAYEDLISGLKHLIFFYRFIDYIPAFRRRQITSFTFRESYKSSALGRDNVLNVPDKNIAAGCISAAAFDIKLCGDVILAKHNSYGLGLFDRHFCADQLFHGSSFLSDNALVQQISSPIL